MQNEKPRISRLLSILTQLQSKRITTAKELALKHHVSTRTIYRDIKTLENSGFPLITEEGKGYSLMDGFYFPPMQLNEKEANALITAEKLIECNKDHSLIDAYKEAMYKIKAILRYKEKDKTDLLSKRIIFRNNREKERTSNLVALLQPTITNFQICEMEYHSLAQKTTHRSIEPFAIYSTQNNWLLIAFCRLRNEFRKFRVDCIIKLVITNKNFKSHEMTLQEYFEKFG
ncbi:HTH domain-containing protein [Tenacibaculum sp.]|nr:HTH domain-containing protein [Tenacibaculum sp.]